MLILGVLFFGFIGGVTCASIFSAGAYNKGYEDGYEDGRVAEQWKTKRT